MRQVVLGQEAATREVLVCLLARGHILLEGVPGTAKTLLVRALALALEAKFVRIQFTPDLMPADITGITLLTGTHEFTFRQGPIFADLVLADEINRAPAKTQAALLEAMQERTVTVDGKSHPLPQTFTVFATQNPIEFEGTYPLPEAELDRFMVKALVGYPAASVEQGILTKYVEGFEADRPATYGVKPVTNAAGLEQLRTAVETVRVEPRILAYITTIVRATREAASLTLGASPRAGVALLKAARAAALIEERDFVIPDDVKLLAPAVLRHRISVAPELELEGVTADQALDAMLLADAALVAVLWLDAFLAVTLDQDGLLVWREPLPALSVGHAGEVAYRWSNGGPRRARLRVREIRPDLLGGVQPPHSLAVPADGDIRETLSVVPLRRGREESGGFVVDSYGPLGLGRRRAHIDLPWEVIVYPPLVSIRLRASLAQAQRRREAGQKSVRELGEGRLFESLREWVPGDDIRHIDWKATARRRKVITRQYEAERRQQVLLVLDLGRLMTADIAGGVARLDFVVQAALELAYAAAQNDDDVGIMTFADGVQHFVAPQRGRAGVRQVLDVLAVVEPKLVEPDYPGAFRYLAARNRKRALTVLFTDVIDRFASDALVANVASLRPRHVPLAVTLRNPELDAVAALRPADPRDAFRKAAAEELLNAREEALAHMRRAGVLVIDVTPQRAAQAVVSKYVDLKRRGVV